MPLPNGSIEWPPKNLNSITSTLGAWDAWYAGDPAMLSGVYQKRVGLAPLPRPRASTYRGGVVGTIARWFWGSPIGLNDEPKIRIHVPLAADICQASADLLFADPPQLIGVDDPTNNQIEVYQGDGLTGLLAQGAEVCAALGGSYLRASWDDKLQGHAFLNTVDADAAYPEFQWGRLKAVTFWWVLERLKGGGTQTVYRHLERHELDSQGIGVIEHGLYEGTNDQLGRRIPLTVHPSTAGLTVNSESQISTMSPGLAVTYVPNLLPQRVWRNHPIGRNLGRSDLDGVESHMDALDRVYSSWMRDIDLGKGRITVPNYMLEVNGPGEGVTFNLDREVYQGVNAEPGSGVGISISQFQIRVAEHQATAQQLVEDILRSCGYSAQTFGEDESGGAATATEIVSRDRRSMLTRDRKIRLWKPAIQYILQKMLMIDQAVFRIRVNPEELEVKFSDSSQDTPLQLAQTAQAMLNAQAASAATRVKLIHPDWAEQQVNDEVNLILKEQGMNTSTPFDNFTDNENDEVTELSGNGVPG